jgi:Xaa-Pro aminopeptidase
MVRLIDCLAAMERADLDALVLGRDAHVRAITGEVRLWLAGTRPFTPACVVIRTAKSAHVPPIMWNPANLAELLRRLPGFTAARSIGVDGMTPAARSLLASVVPDATLVDATPMLRALLRVKTPDEIEALRAAAAVAVDAFAEMIRGLEPGVTAAQLRGRFAQGAAAYSVTTPAFEAIATPWTRSTWWSTAGPLPVGDAPVVLRGGVLRAGWEASLARTYRGRNEVVPAQWDAVVAACTPGARVGELFITHGVGRGLEVLDDDAVLEPGMVVAVELEAGGVIRQDVALITDDAPEVLTAR